MNMSFLIDLDACQTAAAVLRARKARNLSDLEALERQHQQNLIDFIRGKLTDADLDQLTAERQRLEALCHEDHTLVLEAITSRRDTLLKQATNRRNAEEQYQRRKQFADKFNQILAGTDSCDAKTLNWLKENRPGDLDSAAFWRFETHMGPFDMLPKAKREPFGKFCRCEPYVPAPLEH